MQIGNLGVGVVGAMAAGAVNYAYNKFTHAESMHASAIQCFNNLASTLEKLDSTFTRCDYLKVERVIPEDLKEFLNPNEINEILDLIFGKQKDFLDHCLATTSVLTAMHTERLIEYNEKCPQLRIETNEAQTAFFLPALLATALTLAFAYLLNKRVTGR